MADKVTTVESVSVRVLANNGYGRTYKIENPVEGLNMATIRSKFAPMLNMNVLLEGTMGTPLTTVESATLTTTRKVQLDSTVTASVTPSEFTISTGSINESVNVDGATVLGAYVTDITYATGNDNLYILVNGQTVTLMGELSEGNNGKTATVTIALEGGSVNVPVIISNS